MNFKITRYDHNRGEMSTLLLPYTFQSLKEPTGNDDSQLGPHTRVN